MASPFKNLLSPRVFTLSPLVRNFAAAVPKTENKNYLRPNSVAKQLFPNETNTSNETIRINIVDYDDCQKFTKDLIINTPNKNELLSKGIEKKTLFNVLGRGSFGTVIRGIHKNQKVAIKIIQNQKQSVEKEKNALELKHENIVHTIEVITNEMLNYCLVFMEYYEGAVQLQDLLDPENLLNFEAVVKFSLDISRGLQHFHENGILHLDLKPKNVLVVKNSCKICDFGNSLVIGKKGDYQHQGTVIYTDPEILKGNPPTEKSDIYSLGILMWQLKYGKQPYEDIDNSETIIYKVVKCQLRPKHNTNCKYSQLFTECWQCEAKMRPTLPHIIQQLKTMSQ